MQLSTFSIFFPVYLFSFGFSSSFSFGIYIYELDELQSYHVRYDRSPLISDFKFPSFTIIIFYNLSEINIRELRNVKFNKFSSFFWWNFSRKWRNEKNNNFSINDYTSNHNNCTLKRVFALHLNTSIKDTQFIKIFSQAMHILHCE